MRKTGFLLRFIDLGLVLLMAFLAVADIEAEVQVQLPGAEASDAGRAVFYRVHFDETMRARVEQLPEGKTHCTAEDLAALSACMQAAGRNAFAKTGQQARFVLSPEGAATVQHLVILLDLCVAEGLSCTIES